MRKKLIPQSSTALLILLLFAATTATAGEPKAVLEGPATKQAGKLAIIKTKGSVGADYSFQCVPKNDDWQVLKSLDNEMVIIFSTDVEGTYHFFMAAVKDNKVSTAIHEIKIGRGSPTPPIPIPDDPLTKALKSAYDTDIAAGVGTADQKATLSLIYKNAATITVFDKNLTKPEQIWDTMRAASAKLLPTGALPTLRAKIAEQQKALLKITPATMLDDTTRQTISMMLTRIHQTLESLVVSKSHH